MCDRVAILVSGRLRWVLGQGVCSGGVLGITLVHLILNLMENTGLDAPRCVFLLCACRMGLVSAVKSADGEEDVQLLLSSLKPLIYLLVVVV